MNKLIAYYRVSTTKQGRSGLGLDAQQADVVSYERAVAGKVIAAYREIETGKGADPTRPELREAITHAKRAGATLVIAKLDRLSRNLAFLANLMEGDVDFVCCDNPHANRLTLHILAAIAEHEAGMISDRTRAALAAARAKGKKLGSARPGHWDGMCRCKGCHGDEAGRVGCRVCGGSGEGTLTRQEARSQALARARPRAVAVRRQKSIESHREACAKLLALRRGGMTLNAIAEQLNSEDYLTPRGRYWNHVYVFRFLKRCEETQAPGDAVDVPRRQAKSPGA